MNGDVDVRGRRVVVIGAAVAGAAAAEVLALEGADVLVSEALPAEQLDTVPAAASSWGSRWRPVVMTRRTSTGPRSS